MGYTILIADDDYLLRDLLRDILEKENYQVLEAQDGAAALACFRQNPEIALVILDIMMPGMNGKDVLKEIRKSSEVPVIMLTALGDSQSELEGLTLGACDYVSKPFHGEILLARIRAALKYKADAVDGDVQKWNVGKLTVSPQSCRVAVAGEEIVLTNKEYQLLVYLMENRNIVLTRDQILERIWGFDYDGDIRTIDTHIKMLRTDLKSCGEYIRTVRGIGYVFRLEDSL